MSTDERPAGYRDERHSLAAENARLKAELEGMRGARRSKLQLALAALMLLGLDAGVFSLVVRWVNSPRDGDVWLGWAAAALAVALNVVVAQRVLRARG